MRSVFFWDGPGCLIETFWKNQTRSFNRTRNLIESLEYCDVLQSIVSTDISWCNYVPFSSNLKHFSLSFFNTKLSSFFSDESLLWRSSYLNYWAKFLSENLFFLYIKKFADSSLIQSFWRCDKTSIVSLVALRKYLH